MTLQEPEPDRDPLLRGLVAAFGAEEAANVLGDPSLRWDGLLGCWTFTRWGMLIGVEPDGYVHS